jgi:glycosyltransferase involved in cell wall biosynthesis
MKISIITVCYNSEKTIRNTLESINSQTSKKIEHLIIDGQSTDNTLSIVDEFLYEKKIVSERDKGIYDAMNKGIKLAQGEIIGFLNSDDFYANNEVISKLESIFGDDPTLEACYADLIYTDQIDTSRVIRYWKSSKFILGSFSKGWCPPHPTFFVRKSVFKRFGSFDLSYGVASDVDLMMRFLEVNKIKVRYVPELWVKMRSGGVSNNSLKNTLKQNQNVLRALKSHGLSANFISFYTHKFFLRSKQFFQRPTS